MKVLCIPSSEHGYVKRLNSALRARGIDVTEAPLPYLRWPGNVARFVAKMLGEHDLVHIHWNLSDSVMATRLFFSLGKPKVWTVHNITPHHPQFKDDLSVTRLYLDSCDVAVWHSQRTISDTKRLFSARGWPDSWNARDFVIPVMSFNGAWPDTISESDARSRTGFGEQDFVVGHFSPSHPYKGTERFLEVASKLRTENVKFCVFGACGVRSLEQKIRDTAARLGNMKLHLTFVPDEELQYWYKACNVVVQPYQDITSSATILFGIAFKRPVIAPPMGNIPDVIQDGETGWLATTADEISICIKKAREDPTVARAIGERAYEFVEKTAGLDKISASYTEAYESAIER